MKKIFGAIAGVIVGYIAWQIVRYVILSIGPFVLGPAGVSGPRVAANLEAGAEIAGLIVFIMVVRKIYQLVVSKNSKTDKALNIKADGESS